MLKFRAGVLTEDTTDKPMDVFVLSKTGDIGQIQEDDVYHRSIKFEDLAEFFHNDPEREYSTPFSLLDAMQSVQSALNAPSCCVCGGFLIPLGFRRAGRCWHCDAAPLDEEHGIVAIKCGNMEPSPTFTSSDGHIVPDAWLNITTGEILFDPKGDATLMNIRSLHDAFSRKNTNFHAANAALECLRVEIGADNCVRCANYDKIGFYATRQFSYPGKCWYCGDVQQYPEKEGLT